MTTIPAVGDRVRLIQMGPDPDPIEPGATGTVTGVDEYNMRLKIWGSDDTFDATHFIEVDWDSGRSLDLVVPLDTFEVIDDDD